LIVVSGSSVRASAEPGVIAVTDIHHLRPPIAAFLYCNLGRNRAAPPENGSGRAENGNL
jgi:hypothetical protein